MSPARKPAGPAAARTHARFLAKVEVLERWVREGGAPAGEDWPRGVVGLARWTDAGRGLEAWGSPNVAWAKGPYPDLRGRFDAAVAKLGRLDSVERLAPSRRAIALAKAQNTALREQVMELESRLRQAEDRAERLAQLHREAEARAAALAADVAAVVPLRRVP